MTTAMHDRAAAAEEPTCAPVGQDAAGKPVYARGYRRADGVWVCPPSVAPRPERSFQMGTWQRETGDGTRHCRRKPGAT